MVKLEHYKELFQKFKKEDGNPCPLFKEGQEFIIKKYWEVPKGFCEWAWADIRIYIQQIFFGESSFVACCTDGLRPVLFNIERIEVEIKQ